MLILDALAKLLSKMERRKLSKKKKKWGEELFRFIRRIDSNGDYAKRSRKDVENGNMLLKWSQKSRHASSDQRSSGVDLDSAAVCAP
jgi:hypothetical protein